MTRERTSITKSTLQEYATLVAELKERIRSARIRATRSVNRELINLYWDIGKAIVERQKRLGWGKAIVEKLAHDLRVEFPDQTGFSSRNLWEMRLFYETYSTQPKLQQLVAELPWGQNLVILHSLQENKEREYYLRAAAQYGWSRAILTHQLPSVSELKRQLRKMKP
jgi:predicted nuclease of restriction endonuclease-like (RecB) superfamily